MWNAAFESPGTSTILLAHAALHAASLELGDLFVDSRVLLLFGLIFVVDIRRIRILLLDDFADGGLDF
ncbi:hypothetical protein D3C80_2076800 [compost metagenome]